MINELNYRNELEKSFKENSDFDYSLLKNKTIMFTGACGLLGRYFIDFVLYASKKLNLNTRIIALELKREVLDDLYSEYMESGMLIPVASDVTKPINIESSIDYCIQATSPANRFWFSNYPVDVINANINGTFNMLNLAKEKKARFLFISSGEIYGDQECPLKGFTENQPGIVDSSLVRSCYTESKRCSETLAISFAHQYNIEAMVARLCYVYGPTYTPNEKRVFFQFLYNYLDEKDIVMKSKGEQVRSYLYVSDAVLALLHIICYGQNKEAYNVSTTDKPVSVKDIADTFVKLSNGNIKVVFELAEEESKGFSKFMNAVQDPSKLMDLGYKPKVSFIDGVKRTINSSKK